MSGKPVNTNYFKYYDVLIVSPGGMACTYIHDIIGNRLYKNDTNNNDNLKHLYSPDSPLMSINDINKVLYIYNDPLLAILSHFRRGWACVAHRTINPHADIPEEVFADIETFAEHTIQQGNDVFGIYNHFNEWYTKCTHDICFVDFRDTDRDQKLTQFLNIPIHTIYNMRESSKFRVNIPDKFIDIYKKVDMRIREHIIHE
jgi:hypothetical protein